MKVLSVLVPALAVVLLEAALAGCRPGPATAPAVFETCREYSDWCDSGSAVAYAVEGGVVCECVLVGVTP